MAKYRGKLRITVELLEELLQLPEGVEVIDVSYDRERDILDLSLCAIEEVGKLTFKIPEGGEIPISTHSIHKENQDA